MHSTMFGKMASKCETLKPKHKRNDSLKNNTQEFEWSQFPLLRVIQLMVAVDIFENVQYSVENLERCNINSINLAVQLEILISSEDSISISCYH